MEKRLLLVDDHAMVRSGWRQLLEAKYEICGKAGNGQEAIGKAVALKPDLVIMDMTMPVMNGADAARKIRALLPQTKILMVSLHDGHSLELSAQAAGADAAISKSSQDLPVLVDRLLGAETRLN